MKLDGCKVVHNSFGNGVIKSCDGKYVYVEFDSQTEEKAEWEDMYGDLDYEELYEEYMNDPESFYDSAAQDAMGVDPYEAARPDDDEWKKQQAEEAWEEYNKTEPDISDGVIKP